MNSIQRTILMIGGLTLLANFIVLPWRVNRTTYSYSFWSEQQSPIFSQPISEEPFDPVYVPLWISLSSDSQDKPAFPPDRSSLVRGSGIVVHTSLERIDWRRLLERIAVVVLATALCIMMMSILKTAEPQMNDVRSARDSSAAPELARVGPIAATGVIVGSVPYLWVAIAVTDGWKAYFALPFIALASILGGFLAVRIFAWPCRDGGAGAVFLAFGVAATVGRLGLGLTPMPGKTAHNEIGFWAVAAIAAYLPSLIARVNWICSKDAQR